MINLFITWDVSPIICKLGSIEIRWYGILFACAFIVSYLLLKKLFQKDNVPISYLDKLTLYVFIAVWLVQDSDTAFSMTFHTTLIT